LDPSLNEIWSNLDSPIKIFLKRAKPGGFCGTCRDGNPIAFYREAMVKAVIVTSPAFEINGLSHLIGGQDK
jgi:hypothetical protein